MSKNPDVGEAACVEPSAKSPSRPKTKIPGDAFRPKLDAYQNAGVTKEYVYWVGVTPGCPVGSLDIAGINFPKVNEKLVPDPMRTGLRKRVPVVGALVTLSEDKIRKIRERVPRTVIRMLKGPAAEPAKEEPGTGQNVGDNHIQPRRGYPITIPTEEEIALRKAKGKPTRAYTPQASDVPASHFMFARLCPDQEHPSRGEFYPEVLEESGLEWPDELEEKEALLE